jgi:hypothetical protein
MFDTLPSVLLILFLAFCVLWLIVRAFRKLLRTRRRREVPPDTIAKPYPSYPKPLASTATRSVSTIPDAADVLALKAAIDNLARQVAVLEQRLAAGSTVSKPIQASSIKSGVEPASALPPVTPDHRI